jgi:malonyl-CoA O-methyltransferase
MRSIYPESIFLPEDELFKQRIADNFTRAAQDYDRHAQAQARISQKLSGYLPVLTAPQTSVLEIGCGTGIFSAELRHKYPNAHLTLNDFSKEMIDRCREKLPESENTRYCLGDAEKLTTDPLLRDRRYDLIVSNLTFQWFTQQSATIAAYRANLLMPGGMLLFSSLGEETFGAWFESLKEAGAPIFANFSHNPPPKTDYKFFERFQMVENYPDGLAFLKNVKGVGAHGSKGQTPISRSILEKAIRIFEEKYRAVAVYDVIIAVI